MAHPVVSMLAVGLVTVTSHQVARVTLAGALAVPLGGRFSKGDKWLKIERGSAAPKQLAI